MTPVFSLAVVAGVALGGGLGAVVRLMLDRWLPFGVLAANTLGCLLLGWLFGELSAPESRASATTGLFSEPVMTVLVFGVIGALSTFATVSVRVAQLWIARERLRAAGMWLLNVTCGFAAAAAGIALSGL